MNGKFNKLPWKKPVKGLKEVYFDFDAMLDALNSLL